MMPQGMHEAAVPENFNLISITGMHIGKQSFYGQGAGRFPTAYNVMQDCLDIRNGLTRFYTDKLRPGARGQQQQSCGRIMSASTAWTAGCKRVLTKCSTAV